MSTALITGANRGIGLALVKKFLAEGWKVHACCRNPDAAEGLLAINSEDLYLHHLDVSNDKSINTLREDMAGTTIDLLLNNAGIAADAEKDRFGSIDFEEWAKVHLINTMAPVKMLTALYDNLLASEGKLVITISSMLASIAHSQGHMATYSSSKTAMNAIMKGLSSQLAEHGIRTNMLSPGWVQTDMGGREAPLSTTQSAELLFNNITAIGPEDTGLYLDHEGKPLPW